MQTEALYQAVLAAFTLQRADQDDDATMARAATDILFAFAGVIAEATVVAQARSSAHVTVSALG